MADYIAWNDEALVHEYRKTQNQQILALLFERYADVGFRTAMRFVKNQADAEDVLQMSYIHFIQNIDLFREGISIRPWLMKMIVNTCKNKVIEETRRQKRQQKVASIRFDQIGTKNTDIEDDNEKAELVKKLRKSVDSLPEKYRSPLWLVLFEEIPYAEVSLVLSLPEKTIRTQVSRGLEKLRQSMSSFGSALSVIAISELIKEAKLEKSPVSINELIHSPKLFHLAKELPLKKFIFKYRTTMFWIKLVLIFSLTTLIALFAFMHNKKDEAIDKKLSNISNARQLDSKLVSMHLALDFNQKNNVLPYLHLGEFQFLEKGGIKKSGCLEISKTKLILKFSVENVQFPLKLTYRSNTKVIQGETLSGSLVGWSSWSKMSMLYDFSKPKLVPFSNGENYPFELDKDWEDNTVWITKNTIDIWCFGKRMNVYILEHNEGDKTLYLYLLNNTKIDNLMIESVDPSQLPDITPLIKINADVLKNTSEEISSIKKYFQNNEIDFNPKLQQYKGLNETELLQAMEYMILPK